MQLAGVEAADLVAEGGIQPVEALDQRPRQLVEGLALAGRDQAPPAALEQLDAEVTLQGL